MADPYEITRETIQDPHFIEKLPEIVIENYRAISDLHREYKTEVAKYDYDGMIETFVRIQRKIKEDPHLERINEIRELKEVADTFYQINEAQKRLLYGTGEQRGLFSSSLSDGSIQEGFIQNLAKTLTPLTTLQAVLSKINSDCLIEIERNAVRLNEDIRNKSASVKEAYEEAMAELKDQERDLDKKYEEIQERREAYVENKKTRPVEPLDENEEVQSQVMQVLGGRVVKKATRNPFGATQK